MAVARSAWATGAARRARQWPEWWVAGGVVVAWVALVAGHLTHGFGQPHAGPGPALSVGPSGLPAALGDWTVMSVAMMTPITLPAVRHVAINSFAYRRTRAMALYVAAYSAVWVVLGVVVLVAVDLLAAPGAADRRLLIAGSLALAGAWQVGRFKRRALLGCRKTVPLWPHGLRADVACLRFGAQQGLRCLRSCWALMWLMAVIGHTDLLLAAGLTVFITAEELTRTGRRLTIPAGAAFAVAALFAVVV